MAGILDIVALRSLVAISDSGGFRKAADGLHLSQSAVSQHVRRLEQACGRPLVQKEGSGMRFTPAGELLVSEAQVILRAHDEALARVQRPFVTRHDIVIGSTEHGADLLLPAITAQVRSAFPESDVRFRIDRGQQLNEQLDDGDLDASVFIGDVRGADARPAGALPLGWYAAPGWRRSEDPDEPVPLIVINEPCTLRRRAIQVLADHHTNASVVCEAGHLSGVMQAARAGLGVALLAHIGRAPEGLVRQSGLPAVSPEPLHVRGRAGASAQLVPAIATAASAAVAGLLPEVDLTSSERSALTVIADERESLLHAS